MGVRRCLTLVLRRAPGNPREARLPLAHGVKRAALGRAGVKLLKREGDGGTPFGCFCFREVLYRADRGPRPRTRLQVKAIRAKDGWCDDPNSANYNRLVKLPPRRSAEGLTRSDHLYDVILVIGYNDRPRIKGRGSAIFVHLARPEYSPTDGCVALSRRDLLALLRHARPGGALRVMS
jgi:L,D-peptidoglycan transpeptidase YkuD (ErfK/YbiS/YcfS/YnhG family)